MQNSKTPITFFSAVITRLDRVIHMVKVRLNGVFQLRFTGASYAHLQIHTHRESIAWIARSSRAMTVKKDSTVGETMVASSLTPLRGAAFGW